MVNAMSEDLRELTSPEKIAAAGERLYEPHRKALEAQSPGQFAVVDVLTGEVYVRQFPEEVLAHARSQAPNGVFHLIRIGSDSAYRVSHLLHGHSDRVLR